MEQDGDKLLPCSRRRVNRVWSNAVRNFGSGVRVSAFYI